MNRILITAAVAALMITGFADQPKPTADATQPKADAAQQDAARKARNEQKMRYTGGRVEKPGVAKGWVALVDLQNQCPENELVRAGKRMRGYSDCHTTYVKGSEALAKVAPLKLGEAALKETGANIAVILVASDELPPMMVAPEARWAIVNVNALKKNLPEGDLGKALFNGRCRKEAMRAFSIACGGSGSQYIGTVVNAATPEELDKLDEAIPLDNVLAYNNFLGKIGVKKRYVTTYRHACMEGWAPAPTNDYQKAVWDEFHTLPTKPMVIEPESKKSK